MRAEIGILILLLLLPAAASGAGAPHPETLTLEQAVERALSYHPSLRSRKDAIEAAAQGRKSAEARRWLRADLTAQAERHSDPVAVLPIKGWGQFPEFSRDIYLWELRLSLPLYEGGRIAKEVKLKELETKVQESLLRQSTEDLIANVKQVFYQILYLQELLGAQEQIVGLLRRQKEEAELKYRLGRTARLDLLYMERALKEEEALKTATAENLALARRILAMLIGLEGDDFRLQGRLALQEELEMEEECRDCIDMRPDVAAAELKVHQAHTSLERAIREYLPSISLFSSYGRRAGSGLHYDEEVWTSGLRLDLNLFESGATRSRIRQARAQLSAAKEELRAVKLKARQEIASAASRIKAARAKLQQYMAAQQYAEEAYRVESVKYRTGAGAVTDLLSAQEAWLRARSALLRAYFDLRSAQVAYELAAGRIAGS